MAKAAFTIDKLRAWYSHRQGLDGALAGAKPADVLKQSGWARSVGGVGPYLTLHSRAGVSREAADAAVSNLEIHELPSARNCTYVLPAEDFALGLKVGQRLSGGDLKTGYRLGVTEKEIDKLCDGVVKALGKGPMDPDQIREATGNLSRSLGEEGKKKGVTTTLPLALGKLQTIGEIRRVPINGRLDQQRYRYTLWRPNPLEKFKLTEDEAFVELARRFFGWTGPATPGEFQTFAGLGVKATKDAIAPLGLVPLPGGDRLMFPDDLAQLEAFATPKQPQYVLVSLLDSISLLRDDLKRDMLDPGDMRAELFKHELPSHGILDRGRVVGFWEYDPSTESIAWTAFIKKNRDLEKAVAQTEEYVRTQLGDARSFSLDSPKSRLPKIAALRASG